MIVLVPFFSIFRLYTKVFLKKWVRTMCPLQLLMRLNIIYIVHEKKLAELLLSTKQLTIILIKSIYFSEGK